MRMLLLAAAIAAIPATASAQTVTAPTTVTPIVLGPTGYTQNFNTLNSGLPAGFQISETGDSAATVNGNYTTGTGSANTGDTYNFGTTAAPADRALGTLLSGSNAPSFGAIFTNGFGAAITSLTFSFAGEQYRSVAGAGVDRLDFQYRIGGGAINTGTFVDFNALDILSSVNATTGAVDGNVNRTLKSATISGLNIAANQNFAFRFVDFDLSGSDTGLALDDLSVSATAATVAAAAPEPATWALMILGFGLVGGTLRRRTARRLAAI